MAGDGSHAPFGDLPVWSEALARLARQVSELGASVVVMGPTPMFDFDVIANCLLSVGDPACGGRRPGLVGQVQPVLGLLRDTAKGEGNLFVFDPFEVLCPADVTECSPALDGIALFRDADHLNAHGAAILSDPFSAFLATNGLLK
ncbi:MAG TPA: SGNH hydrolase domain-containing protein [Devosia sp.]|nr:SGNH hydrolase domain-containing protein [Devosia sp.]